MAFLRASGRYRLIPRRCGENLLEQKKRPVIGGVARRTPGMSARDLVRLQMLAGNRAMSGLLASEPSAADVAAYYDSPGPDVVALYSARPLLSRIVAKQNFTGWIEGQPTSGGSVQRLCDVAAWYSVVSLINVSDDPRAVPRWQRFTSNEVGTGWVDFSTHPEL